MITVIETEKITLLVLKSAIHISQVVRLKLWYSRYRLGAVHKRRPHKIAKN